MTIGNPAAENKFTKTNVFDTTPKGFVIFDSRNNPWYPFEEIILDTPQYNFNLIWKEYLKKYSLVDRPLFAPWHYTVEMIDKEPQILVTRPISYKSLIPGYEEWISICILGDSTRDIYTPRYYMKIADIIINPIRYIQSWRLHPELNKTLKLINMGENFIPEILEKYIK